MLQNSNLHDFQITLVKSWVPPLHLSSNAGQLLDQVHVPDTIPKEGRGGTKRRRCQQCSKAKKRKLSIYECPNCLYKPALCLGNCFRKFHGY